MFEQIAPTVVSDPAVERRDLGGLLGLKDQQEVAFPLREVRVRTSIAGDCCRTVVEQVFANPYSEGLEAVHLFPLPPDGAVTELELVAGGVVVRGECREREAAERAFDQAKRTGRRAALLTAERADVHTVRVTNVPPHTEVRVRLAVIERLTEIDGAFIWRFPTVLAPRYLPGAAVDHSGQGVLPDTDRVPDASRLQPPLRLAGGVTLDLEVELAGPLAALESSLHAVRATLGDTVRVALSGQATLDRDFVLRFKPAAAAAAPVRAYSDGAFTLAVISPPEDAVTHRVPRDVVIVLDISGSMDGEKLDAAKQALRSVLHGLDPEDRFRIIAFESSLHPQTPDLQPYTQRALDRADRWVARLAPTGGTEMLPALVEAFSGETPPGRLRTVIFITDGQVWDESELVATVERQRRGALLYTVGIDTAVNESLLARLARVGGGTCEIVSPHDDIEEAIVRLETRIGFPVVTDLDARGLESARPQRQPVFAGRPVSVLLRGTADEVVFDARDAAGSPIELRAHACQTVSFPLGALWARERVAWLEDQLALAPEREAELRAEILAIALEHHLASRSTALVAVEERVSHEGTRVTVVQPVELPALWSDAFRNGELSRGQVIPCMAPAIDAIPARRSDRWLAKRSAPMPRAMRLFRKPLVRSGRTGARPAGPLRELETALAVTQSADGSFGGSVERTAAAVVALVRMGHTRRKGTRRRVVEKAARWLARRRDHPLAALALALLERVEAGGDLPLRAEVKALLKAGAEGAALAKTLE